MACIEKPLSIHADVRCTRTSVYWVTSVSQTSSFQHALRRMRCRRTRVLLSAHPPSLVQTRLASYTFIILDASKFLCGEAVTWPNLEKTHRRLQSGDGIEDYRFPHVQSGRITPRPRWQSAVAGAGHSPKCKVRLQPAPSARAPVRSRARRPTFSKPGCPSPAEKPGWSKLLGVLTATRAAHVGAEREELANLIAAGCPRSRCRRTLVGMDRQA